MSTIHANPFELTNSDIEDACSPDFWIDSDQDDDDGEDIDIL